MAEDKPNPRRDHALLQLLVWSAKETEATRNRCQWLIEAKDADASWADLGAAMGLSRETARARWKAAVKAAEAEEAAAAADIQETPPEPSASVEGATPTTVSGPLPAAVH